LNNIMDVDMNLSTKFHERKNSMRFSMPRRILANTVAEQKGCNLD
jgi:hypothetical protein